MVSRVLCPRCGNRVPGGTTFFGDSKPFCPLCGWNVQQAKEQAQKGFKSWTWGWAFLATFFGLGFYVSRDSSLLFPLLFMSAILAAATISSRTRWRKLKNLGLGSSFITPSAQAQTLTAIGNYDHLRSLAKPRGVRFKFVPKAVLLVYSISCLAFGYFVWDLFRQGVPALNTITDAPILAIAVVWSAMAFSVLRRASRDRRLLAEGEFAPGRIMHQWMERSGRSRRSRVSYEFKDSLGRVIYGETTDDSNTLFEEMRVGIFYDQINPQVSIPMPCASCELKEL